MGNNCMSQNQAINQKEQVISINCDTNLKRSCKQKMHPQFQNLTQNLDTFDEDFYKNEFLLDFSNDNITNPCSSKNKLEKTDIDDIQQNITQQCPSLNIFDEQKIQYKINLNTPSEDPLNQAFIRRKKKQDGKALTKNKKQFKKPVEKKNRPRSILKQNQQNQFSLSHFSDQNSRLSVTFNLSPSQTNKKNARSMSPIVQTKIIIKPKIHTKSMICMQQFPYI